MSKPFPRIFAFSGWTRVEFHNDMDTTLYQGREAISSGPMCLAMMLECVAAGRACEVTPEQVEAMLQLRESRGWPHRR